MRRSLISTVILLALVAMLAGQQANAQDGEKPYAGEQVLSTFMQDGRYDASAQDLAPGFEEETGIDLEIIAAPWAILNQSNITDLTTGTGEYDVMAGEFWIASVYGHMLSLDSFIEQANMGDAFIEGIWAPGPSGFYDGQRVGIPFVSEAYGIVHRTDLFEEYGIDDNWRTWDDFIARLDELQVALKDTDIAPMVFAWGAPEQVPAVFLGIYDGYVVNAEGTQELDPEKAVPALEKMRELLNYNPSGATALSIDEANAIFLSGKAATLVGWVGFFRSAGQDPDQSLIVDKWKTDYYPGPGFPFLSCWNLFISKYTDNPEASWEWIKYFMDEERAKERFVKYGIMSPYRSTYEDEELLAKYSNDFPAQLENLNRAMIPAMTFEAYEILYRNMGEFIIGSISAEEMVSSVNEEWLDLVVPEALIQAAEAQGIKQAG